MPRHTIEERNKNRRSGGLKQNLALPGSSNRRNVQGGIGQVQDQASPIVSEKKLEQPVVKPGGIRRTIGRVRDLFGRTGGSPSVIAAQGITKKLSDVASRLPTPTRRPTTTAKAAVVPETEAPLKRGEGRLTVTTGPRQGAKRGDVGGGLTELSRGVAPAKRKGSNIGRLAGALFEQRSRAGGIAARRKAQRAETKATTGRIKALSSALKDTELLADVEGETKIADFRNNLRTQIADLAIKGAGGGQDAVLNDAARFLKAGFSREEVESIMGRLGNR